MVTRIGGLASGMDIDELVKKLMQAERAPLNKLTQKKQTYEWQRDAYRSVNTKIKTFDTYISDNLVLKTLNSKTATSSNSSLVSATATGKATGTLSIEGVSQLATSARGLGEQINATGTTKLSALGIDTSKEFKIKAINSQGELVESAGIKLDANMTVDQFVSKINSSNAGVSAVFESGRLSITAKNTGKEVNGQAAISTDAAGNEVFAKLGLSSLVTEEGKNAIFQVNGISTERTSNSFSINGYNVTLNNTFNDAKTNADKYNATYTEWKNTTSAQYTTQITTALTNFNNASSAYTTANDLYNATRDNLFGQALTEEDQLNFAKVNNTTFVRNLSSGDLATLKTQSFADDTEYQAWLNDGTNDSELKNKLKSDNISLSQVQALQELDYDKIQQISAKAILNSLSGDASAKLTNTDISSIKLKGFSDEEKYRNWLNDNNTDAELKAKLIDGNVSLEQFKSLKTIKNAELETFLNESNYNSLGSSFLNGLTDDEKTLLQNSKLKGTPEQYNAQIDTWKSSSNDQEKALGEKLSQLTDSQKNLLREMDSTQLSNLSALAHQEIDTKAKLEIKNTNESEFKALVDRQNKALINFKDAYKQQNSGSEVGYENASAIDAQDVPANTTSPVIMTSSTNVDEMMMKIKEFVTTYNGFIKDLSDQTKESKYREYTPLTTEQKEEMSENEIKLWEEKAKSGLLRNDSIILSGISNMRSLIYQSNPGVENSKFNTLFSVGITTSKNYNEGGTLEIDETKLRAALEEDPDAVEQLFKNSTGKKDDVIDGKTIDTRGYLDKLRESMKTFEQNIDKKAGRTTMTDAQYTIGKSLTDVETRIKTWQDKLENIESRYWKQFTAMETAINKANQQSSLFSQG